MAIFFNFETTSNHLHPQVKNCDSDSRLVVDGDDNGEFRPERGKSSEYYSFEIFSKPDTSVVVTEIS